MALGDLLKTFRQEKPEGIIGKLDRYILQLNGNKFIDTKQDRMTGVWHPSSLSTTECIRKLVFTWLLTPPSNPQGRDPKSRKIFDVGHHSGYQMQGYFWDMGILEGVYHCVKCEHDWWGISPRVCPSCGKKMEIWYNLHYAEVPVVDPDYNIWGHADGLLNEEGKRRLLELKTIKNRDGTTRPETVTFDELNSAKIEHAYQMNLYMHILTKYGSYFNDMFIDLGDIRQGIALYSAKNNQRQKEFNIGLIPEYISPQYMKIEQTNHALENRYLPNKISEDKNCSDCKYCPFRDFCHSNPTFEMADHREVSQEEVVL